MRLTKRSEVARILGLSRETIRRWTEDGTLPAKKIQRTTGNPTYLYDLDAIEAWVDSLPDAAAPAAQITPLRRASN